MDSGRQEPAATNVVPAMTAALAVLTSRVLPMPASPVTSSSPDAASRGGGGRRPAPASRPAMRSVGAGADVGRRGSARGQPEPVELLDVTVHGLDQQLEDAPAWGDVAEENTVDTVVWLQPASRGQHRAGSASRPGGAGRGGRRRGPAGFPAGSQDEADRPHDLPNRLDPGRPMSRVRARLSTRAVQSCQASSTAPLAAGLSGSNLRDGSRTMNIKDSTRHGLTFGLASILAAGGILTLPSAAVASQACSDGGSIAIYANIGLDIDEQVDLRKETMYAGLGKGAALTDTSGTVGRRAATSRGRGSLVVPAGWSEALGGTAEEVERRERARGGAAVAEHRDQRLPLDLQTVVERVPEAVRAVHQHQHEHAQQDEQRQRVGRPRRAGGRGPAGRSSRAGTRTRTGTPGPAGTPPRSPRRR